MEGHDNFINESSYKAIDYHGKCPAVAQPGRAFGCRCWLNKKIADLRCSLLGVQRAVTEESQAQTKRRLAVLEQILPAGYIFNISLNINL